eukprot:TRINITY_DN2917_c0_g1_i3.p1 TRINITY_DN2917_c0_g1~~TRINITY_DN2917_c0_g1_i3.p1  ORF type:complete len:297 (-),score=72.95 TRINITY_DN2917_c0_g1_i3:97-987(-)
MEPSAPCEDSVLRNATEDEAAEKLCELTREEEVAETLVLEEASGAAPQHAAAATEQVPGPQPPRPLDAEADESNQQPDSALVHPHTPAGRSDPNLELGQDCKDEAIDINTVDNNARVQDAGDFGGVIPRTPSKKSSASFCLYGNNAANKQECAICFDYLPERPASVLLDASGRRTCRHYFHYDCAKSLTAAALRNCPLCREAFWRPEMMPDIRQQPKEWFRTADFGGTMRLTREEVLDALGAVLPIDTNRFENVLLPELWKEWDQDSRGIALQEFEEPKHGLLTWVLYRPGRMSSS